MGMGDSVWTPGQVMGPRTVTPFRLDSADLASPTWRKLVKHWEERLQQCRERNDSGDHDAAATAKIRGQIMELKENLKLNTMKPAPEIHDQAE